METDYHCTHGQGHGGLGWDTFIEHVLDVYPNDLEVVNPVFRTQSLDLSDHLRRQGHLREGALPVTKIQLVPVRQSCSTLEVLVWKARSCHLSGKFYLSLLALYFTCKSSHCVGQSKCSLPLFPSFRVVQMTCEVIKFDRATFLFGIGCLPRNVSLENVW